MTTSRHQHAPVPARPSALRRLGRRAAILASTLALAVAAPLMLAPAASAATPPASVKVVTIAKSLAGRPYKTGASGPKAFDCSGFTSYVYRAAGVKKLAHSSSAQRRAGKVVSSRAARPGDLIWTPGHVAIYLGGGKQIDAPKPGGKIAVRKIWQHKPTYIRVA